MQSFDFGQSNNMQKKAITSTEGPLLIIAGPGTGKTFTLIKRVMYLIEEKGHSPENIMLVTFTEKAAKEMLTRLSNELLNKGINLNVNEMYIGTIHSVCLRILKENLEYATLKKNYQLFDEFDQQYFLYQNFWRHFSHIRDFDLVIDPMRSVWDRVNILKKYINSISEELIDIEKLLSSQNLEAKALGEIIQRYEDLRLENNFIDFSTIQTETYKLLSDDSNGVLKKIQEKIKYIMVDEYQDTNYIQEQLVLLIANQSNNLCVVGDDDQGLYRFRGATIRNIIEFEKHFDYCQRIILNENYRSELKIIEFYNDFMNSTEGRGFEFDWDHFRFEKKIIPSKKEIVLEDTVYKIDGSNEEHLNENIKNFILELKNKGKIDNFNQIAFLFRSVKNRSVIALSEYLEEHGISVYSPRSNMFFDREEVRLFIGTILLMFPKLVNRIKENDSYGIEQLSDYYLDCMNDAVSELNKEENSEANTFVKLKARDHLYLSEQNKTLDYSISQLVYQLLQFDLFSNIVTVDLRNGLIETLKSRNISILINTIIKFEFSENINILTSRNIDRATNKLFTEFFLFLYQGGISEYEDETDYAPSGSVSFLTIHQSKGMEFPIVIVGSLYSRPRDNSDKLLDYIEDNYSHRPKFEPRESIKYFDFWRLYYTAFSRAQNLLLLMGINTPRGISNYFEEHFNQLDNGINQSHLSISKIKNTDLKPDFSFTSDVQLYENCQTQYLFFRELGYEQVSYGTTLFGSLVHETIDDIHKAVLRGEADKITADSINIWMMINYDTISRREKKYLSPQFLETAYNQILNYFEKRESQWGSIREAEVPVSLVKENYILSGKIDLIQGENNTYEIIDFKTEKKPDIFRDKDKIDVARRQLEVYAHILQERYGYEISKLKLYYTSETNSNPFIEFNINNSSISKTIEVFNGVVNQIKHKEFSGKAKDRNLCRNCDLRYYCKRT